MSIITKEQLGSLISIGFAASARGMVAQSRVIFNGILAAMPNQSGALTGLAFSYIVVDEFSEGDEILRKIIESDPSYYEASAVLVLSLMLQKKPDEAKKVADGIPEDVTAKALATNALSLEG
ncbi:MAG: tetratricopeptide repeat protein [Succinivibrio sp.]